MHSLNPEPSDIIKKPKDVYYEVESLGQDQRAL